MATDASQSLNAFPMAESGAAAVPARLEDEVASLFDQLRVPVLRYLLAFHIPVPDAEEIVQEVFLALFQHLRRGKPRTNLQGWIFRVAHNAAVTNRVKSRRHSDLFSHVPDICATTVDEGPGPEQNAVDSQRQRRLLAVVRALPEQDRYCMALRAEGLRYREIADVLGMSLGSVAASLEKSLSRLTRAGQT